MEQNVYYTSSPTAQGLRAGACPNATAPALKYRAREKETRPRYSTHLGRQGGTRTVGQTTSLTGRAEPAWRLQLPSLPGLGAASAPEGPEQER